MLVFNADFSERALARRQIIAFAETRAVTRDVAKEYIVTRLLEDRHALSDICEELGVAGESLKQAALTDLRAVMEAAPLRDEMLAAYRPSAKRTLRFDAYQRSVEALVAEPDCVRLLEGLIAHYSRFGGGKEAAYTAFQWEGGLQGVENPEGSDLDRLFCVEAQKKELTENTKRFVDGLSANNVLLYGNSGCGKSSMVKALLARYARDGLRLVQIRKEALAELPLLLRRIKGRRLFRYIVFMDDLSFEGQETGYKTLKTILEGGLEKQPDNVLFYATSNRLHLVGETWAERRGDDIHRNDTMNEKISLSERFGLRLSFLSPAQDAYKEIVAGLLKDAGVCATEALLEDAVRWAWRGNGLSGRTAAQYVAGMLPKAATAKPSR